MTSTPQMAHPKSTLGDSAVDGLLAGTGAGVLMALYVIVAGLLQGQSLASLMAQFDPSPSPSPFTGALAHLAVAGVYGALFAVLWRWLQKLWNRAPGWLAGAAYGLVLCTLALAVLRLPAARPEGWLAAIGPLHLAVAHLVYGLALGYVLGRRPVKA